MTRRGRAGAVARRRLEEVRLAAMLLTRLPMGRLADPAPALSDARWAYPLAGLPVGIIGWAVQGLAIAAGFAPPAAALLALGAMALATGALHHDGLADFADGIGGGRDAAHCLDIMRDSRIGTYGVMALIFAVALEVFALASFEGGAPLLAFVLLGVGSRLAMLPVSILLPPARETGLGHAARADAPRDWAPGAALVLALGLAIGPPALFAGLAMTLAGTAVALKAKVRIGGQTGDVLGAVQRVTEVTGWLALALV